MKICLVSEMITGWRPVSPQMVVFEVYMYLLTSRVHLRKERCSLSMGSGAIFGRCECVAADVNECSASRLDFHKRLRGRSERGPDSRA